MTGDGMTGDGIPGGALSSPHHVVLGASDVAASAAFFGALGFDLARQGPAPAQLYGLTGAAQQATLEAAGRRRGGIRLIGTGSSGSAPLSPDPYRLGFHAIDIYTTDIDRSVAAALDAGGRLIGGPATFDTGAAKLTGAMVHGPDEVPVVFLQNVHRYPSALDDDPNRLTSEVHSLVYAVADINAAGAFWTGAGGLLARGPFDFADPNASSFMGPPGPTRMAMSVLADVSSQPLRLELLEFLEERREHPRGPEQVAAPTLRPGQAWPVFATEDLRAAMAGLSAVDWATPVDWATAMDVGGSGIACIGVAPGGIVLELRESPA